MIKKFPLFLITFLAVAMIVSGCGKKQLDKNINDNQKYSRQNSDLNSDILKTNDGEEGEYKNEDYCLAQPTHADNGRKIYPVNKEKYKSEEFGHIGLLGEIFTADDCGGKRLEELFGGADAGYEDGMTVWLSGQLPVPLVKVLEEMEFKCQKKNLSNDECGEWGIDMPVKIGDLLKLKPYFSNIIYSDCKICG